MSEPCAAIIPAWNESSTIGPLVTEVRRRVEHVIVVDDGSSDATGNVAHAAGAEVLVHPFNRGKGAALRTGLSRARRAGFDWGVTLDADGQHSPDEMPLLWRMAADTSATLVVGNRMPSAASMSWLRRATNRWMSRRLSRRAGQEFPDSQCGFRLLRLDVWERLPLDTEHFEIESELLLAFVSAGQRVEFAAISTRPAPRPSRIRPLHDAWRWWRWWRRTARATSENPGTTAWALPRA
jgi:glycosyltransferase involved in cell wall biosynthesis